METNGVDVERVEGEAGRVLSRVREYVWDGESLPVPVDDIAADEFGLLVRLVDDLSTAPGCENIPRDQLSGLLLTGPGEIWVNAWEAAQWDGRRRFTIGHELGHYVMHRDGRPGIHCRSIVEDPREEAGFENGPDGGIEPVSGAGREVGTDEVETESEARLVAGPRSVPELEANAFAAALIMPRHLMREQYERHEGDCEAMRNEFGASQKAMRYRIDAMKTWG
jgi:hypothetical protein